VRLVAAVAALLLLAPLAAEPLMRGDPAPTFALPALAGGDVRSVDLWGQPTILHFWAGEPEAFTADAWALRDFLRGYGTQRVRAVAIPVGPHARSRAQEAQASLGLDWPIALDEDALVADMYRVTTGSVIYVVDAAGRLVLRHERLPRDETLRGALDRAAAVKAVERPAGKVALTFDDFPHSELSGKLLDVLRHEGVLATFFVLGQKASDEPRVVRRAAVAGHSLQNHTYSHANLTKLSDIDIWGEVTRTSELLQQLTGKASAYLRPPGGWYDARVALKVQTTGHRPVFWTIDTQDMDGTPSAALIRRRAVELARDGSIIMMHDGVQATIDALPGIIADLRAKGFQLVTIEEVGDHASGPW